jgi:hypothetical protein
MAGMCAGRLGRRLQRVLKQAGGACSRPVAAFIAGELLIPLAAAERMAFDGWDNPHVAATYGVSEQFAQMQMRGSESEHSEQPISTDSGLQLCARGLERSLAVRRAETNTRVADRPAASSTGTFTMRT